MPVTAEMKKFYEVFGYLAFKGLFLPEIDELTREFDDMVEKNQSQLVPWDHIVHANLPRLILPDPVSKSKVFAGLLTDPRITGITRSLFDKPLHLAGSDANIFECGSRWHSDVTGFSYGSDNVKIILYFDPMKAAEDAFRVIPGSHFSRDQFPKELKNTVKECDKNLGVSIRDVPSVEIPTKPGDVIAFNARVWHCVPHSGNRRRMVSFTFSDEEKKVENTFQY